MNGESGTSERKSRAHWEELMAAYEASDLPQREFCKLRDIPYSTFGYWRKRLRSPAEPFVELSTFGPGEDTTQWRVELDLGSGLVLRLR